MRIVTIIGARPQFVKAAVVSRAFRSYYPNVSEIIIHTGQHYDKNMSDIFFEELDIPLPDYNLGVGGGTHGQNTGRMIEGIETLLLEIKPDKILVYGDTDSTLAAALAAAKCHIPIAHVEAGLRSYNKKMPEEINRILTDHLSTFLFTPTIKAKSNLIAEGFNNSTIMQVGDVMYDAALYYTEKAKCPSEILFEDEFVLCTIHRAENTDDPEKLKEIIIGLNKSAKKCKIIFPIHPRTRKLLESLGQDMDNITTIDPVSYLEMVWLLKKCRFVVTDSGGLQKEAYFFRKFCLTIRNETEWVELIENGVNALVEANTLSILKMYEFALEAGEYPLEKKLYGTGSAGMDICSVLAG